jgi:hypothetical protein
MKLITKEIRVATPPLYSTQLKAPADILIIAKFFTPWSNWTWYMTELDEDDDLAFGFVVGLYSESGYFTISELKSLLGPGGLTIERDLHFGKHSLAEILGGARP